MTRGVVLLVATFRLLVLLAFIRQLKSGCCRVCYIPLDRVLRVPPAVYCGRGTGDLSGRRTLHFKGVRGRVLGAAPLRSGAPVVVLADGGEPEPGDVDAAVPVDVVSIQADVDDLLDVSCVPMLVLVHALHAVPVGVVTSSPGVLGYR